MPWKDIINQAVRPLIRPCFENTLFPVARPRPFLPYGAKLLLDYDFMNLVNFKLRMRI